MAAITAWYVIVVTTWQMTECDSVSCVIIKCSKRKYSETNNVNYVEINYSILEIELDLEELCELSYMAMHPHVKYVMNDLIMKLKQE
jgi:hypothetical protein